MDWDWNLVLSVVMVVGGIASTWGVMSTRIRHLEKVVEDLKAEVKDFRKLSEDLAVVKHDIHTIKEMIAKLAKESK